APRRAASRLVFRHRIIPRRHLSTEYRSILWPSRHLSVARPWRPPLCLSHTASNTTSSRPFIPCSFLCPGDACQRPWRSRVLLGSSHIKVEKGACHDREARCPVCTSLV